MTALAADAKAPKMLSGDYEQEERLRKSCEALIINTYHLNKLSQHPEAVSAKGISFSRLTGDSSSREENGGAISGMGRESSVDVNDFELERALNSLPINEDRVPNGLVPSSLPEALREDPSSVDQSHVTALYNTARSSTLVTDGTLTRGQVIALHIKAFANILTYEVEQPEFLRRRFLRFFTSVLIDLVELCYPDRGDTSVEELILRDFQASQHSAGRS